MRFLFVVLAEGREEGDGRKKWRRKGAREERKAVTVREETVVNGGEDRGVVEATGHIKGMMEEVREMAEI